MKALPITKEQLTDLYLNEKLNARQIASKIGVGKNCVYYWLNQFEIFRGGHYETMIGQKFGRLTVKAVVTKEGDRKPWLTCVCDCGTQKDFRAAGVRAGISKSCGCSLRKLDYHEQIRGDFFKQIQRSAKTRGHEFNVTIEDVWNLYLAQNKKCAISGVPILLCPKRTEITASLDRIDSSKGYVQGNIQWVHKDVNFMKSDFTEKEFYNWIKTIAEYKGL